MQRDTILTITNYQIKLIYILFFELYITYLFMLHMHIGAADTNQSDQKHSETLANKHIHII